MHVDRPTERVPAVALVAAGGASVQFGAAVATHLFGRVGPAGAVTLRLVLAALLLAVITGATRRRRAGDGRSRPSTGVLGASTADRLVAVAFGLVLAAMNLSFYEAIDRIPLGVAVTVEFAGPFTLAVLGSRRWLDAVWALAAGAGVALLASGTGHHLDAAGVALAFVAGLCWVGYILLSKETGRRFDSLDGLVWAMAAGGLVVLPVGAVQAGGALLRPAVLGLGTAVAVLSSVVPYSLELAALRRLTPRAFGVMLSMEPALAAAAGLAVLGQRLSAREWVALLLVVAANLGNALTGRTAADGGAPLLASE